MARGPRKGVGTPRPRRPRALGPVSGLAGSRGVAPAPSESVLSSAVEPPQRSRVCVEILGFPGFRRSMHQHQCWSKTLVPQNLGGHAKPCVSGRRAAIRSIARRMLPCQHSPAFCEKFIEAAFCGKFVNSLEIVVCVCQHSPGFEPARLSPTGCQRGCGGPAPGQPSPRR